MDDLKCISQWTTGRDERDQLVALLAKYSDGETVGLAMTPEAAIEVGEALAEQGLRLLAARRRPN